MQRTTDYIIVSEGSFYDLEKAVSKKLELGYEPLGGVSYVYTDLQHWVCQAMVKRVEL